MARSTQEAPRLATLAEALNLLTVDELKTRAALLPTAERPTRKDELIKLIVRYLTGGGLRELWEQLDEMQRNAVRETLHSSEGFFNAQRFNAKYGTLPEFGGKGERWTRGKPPTPLRLFLHGTFRNSSGALLIPEDLQRELRKFVTPPSAPVLPSQEELPEAYQLFDRTYDFSKSDEEEEEEFEYDELEDTPEPRSSYIKFVKAGTMPLLTRETERAALQDAQTVLRLIDKGKIVVSDKTLQPSGATQNELATLLRDGDFYEPKPKKNKWEQEIGHIKPFAWPLLVQAGKLAELHGNKLALTKAGRAALNAQAAETLKLLWDRWLKNKLLDEFNRIDVIKGQQGKGKRGMTAAANRRAAINEALQQCPVGRWVKLQDFSRFMQAAAYDFEVTREPWDLYIADAHYGSLGYQGYHDWHILQGRYLLCLLFEYAATLGLIDVAYVDPSLVPQDYEMWGTDDLAFLSRYDGLIYFRLNLLGAYCLGLAESYTPGAIEAKATLSVLPSLQVKISGAAFSLDEALLLETWAEKESDTVWRLDRDKALSAVESGHQIAELREFLAARDEQELPDTVVAFIVTTERNARALKQKGAALLIECADAELAELLATHERTKKLCLRAGEKHLVVKEAEEETFRKAAHLLGYGMPRV
jgi:hypothetical protein